MANNSMNVGIFIRDLLEKTRVDDTDVMIIEDTENTKKVMFRNLRISLVEDNESPASHRIYSSLKVQQMIDDITKKVTDGVGGVQGDIEELQKDKVSKKELDDAIAEIDEKKFDKIDINPIVEELENTRKKSDPITGKDLAYGTEDEKIHIKHLGSDILDAMTGKTQVSIPSVPTGGWTGDDLANESIGAIKLKKNYNFRGNYQDTDGNVNRLVYSGYYEVASSVPGLPHYGDDTDETRLVQVIRYGDNDKWIIQRCFYKEESDEIRPWFERRGLFAKLSILEWIPHYEITTNNKVASDLLSDHYNNRGKMTEGDLFEVDIDGNWLCEPEVKNLPTEDRYLVNIRTFDDRKEYEAKLADVNGCVTFTCYEYYTSNMGLVRTDWFNSTNILKSKFDGKTIHIFGDGISYGLGCTDVLTKSYTSILNKKYGWVISNHALVDATAGNYNDEIFEQSSLLTQIDRSTGLATEDEVYIMIFIGAEDYRSGMAPIGNDDYNNDTTFKGALNLAIEKLQTKCPQARLMLVTPIFRSSTEPGDGLDCDTNLVNDKYLREFADAIMDIAKLNHIPCIDLFNTCMINKYNSGIFLNEDGVYPSDKGHAMIAEKIQDGFNRYY